MTKCEHFDKAEDLLRDIEAIKVGEIFRIKHKNKTLEFERVR